MQSEITIKKCMLSVWQQCVDETGELSTEMLAKTACKKLNDFEGEFPTIPEIYLEYAEDIRRLHAQIEEKPADFSDLPDFVTL
jgi:hypothetical protein